MWFTTLISAILLVQAGGATFETEIAPGEGRPRLRATGPVELREQPESKRPLSATMHMPHDRDLTYDETLYRTVAPGVFNVRVPTSISGRLLGPINRLSREEYYKGRYARGSVTVTPPGTVEYLQYRAEGTCFVRVDGDVVDADDCPTRDSQAFVLVNEPKTEWWVRITRDSKPVGWVLVDDTHIKVVGRAF